MYYLVNASSPRSVEVSTSIYFAAAYRSYAVKSTGHHFIMSLSKGQILYFLVNPSPPKLVGCSNFKLRSFIGHIM